MPNWCRRRIETILLAMVAIATVMPLRFPVESHGWLFAEITCLCLAYLTAEVATGGLRRWSAARRVADVAYKLIGATPLVFCLCARVFQAPIAFEMSALTTCGAISLAMATGATTNRIRSLSLILSGFLVLFSASISDSPNAVVLPIVWMLGCVWHLIANHWERLDLAMPASVQRTWSLRPSIVIVTLLVLTGGAYAVKDRIASSNRLGRGFMPTSGGSDWSDPAARSGVGSGDAAIAAKDHAESFGAVDSDIFLESPGSSLFDMVNDMLGEPKVKSTWERRQAMVAEVLPAHEQAAKSEQGGGAFSTERMPPKKHRHLSDARDDSVIQWDGPTGIRLAMQRYDTFDGQDWTQSADWSSDKLTRVDVGGAAWFFEPFMRAVLLRAPDASSVGLLKVIRLDSQRLPVPMLTAGIHIKQIDRQDFFGITKDGSFCMPGRDRVPPLTVVHVASVSLMEDEIRDSLIASAATGQVESGDRLAALVRDWTTASDLPYDQLQSILNHLRTEFVFEREGEKSATSLDDFLQTRRGSDHLFATTAALMARQIGLSSRLVTGFYVRPDAFDIAAGHASLLPHDVHVWAEVRLEDGRWFEIEPTPGYIPPHYRPSWRLLAGRLAATYWPLLVAGALLVAGIYRARCFLIDSCLTAIWSMAGWLRPRRKLRLAMGIIEVRAQLAGLRRPIGESQRAWLERLTRADVEVASAARQFSDAADLLFFGGKETSLGDATGVVGLLRVRTITALSRKATS
jgi:hypothetical protein